MDSKINLSAKRFYKIYLIPDFYYNIFANNMITN